MRTVRLGREFDRVPRGIPRYQTRLMTPILESPFTSWIGTLNHRIIPLCGCEGVPPSPPPLRSSAFRITSVTCHAAPSTTAGEGKAGRPAGVSQVYPGTSSGERRPMGLTDPLTPYPGRAARARLARTLLAGPRAALCRLSGADRDELLALARASRRFHHPWVSAPCTPAAFEEYLRRSKKDDFQGLLLCHAMDGSILGVFNLSQIFRRGFQSAYLGYWCGAPHARQGYMAEGLVLVLEYAFSVERLHRLEANIQPGNGPSIALVRRAGFRLEGFSPRYLKILGKWRDHERWAICREDWTSARKTARRGRAPRS